MLLATVKSAPAPLTPAASGSAGFQVGPGPAPGSITGIMVPCHWQRGLRLCEAQAAVLRGPARVAGWLGPSRSESSSRAAWPACAARCATHPGLGSDSGQLEAERHGPLARQCGAVLGTYLRQSSGPGEIFLHEN